MMFYVSLKWCYCDNLKPSIKTTLTCLICLQLWLVETRTAKRCASALMRGVFHEGGRSHSAKPDLKMNPTNRTWADLFPKVETLRH